MLIKHAKSLLWDHVFRKRSTDVKNSTIRFLRAIPFFDGLTYWQMNEILSLIHLRTYEENEFVFEQGQPGAALFIVQEGLVAIEINDTRRGKICVAELKTGAFFGEMALIDQAPRSASARAVKSAKVFALFRKDLEELNDSHPEIAAKIFKALASVIGERLLLTNDRLSDQERAA